MKPFHFAFLTLPLFACSLSFGQSAGTTPNATASLDAMKTLAGTWQGSLTIDSPAWATDKPLPLTIRVASHGNALVHELDTEGPEITVFYMEGDHLALVHYCDFGNRPHMTTHSSVSGNVITFSLRELLGSEQISHVSQAVFTLIDANHHIEDWVFLPTGQNLFMHTWTSSVSLHPQPPCRDERSANFTTIGSPHHRCSLPSESAHGRGSYGVDQPQATGRG